MISITSKDEIKPLKALNLKQDDRVLLVSDLNLNPDKIYVTDVGSVMNAVADKYDLDQAEVDRITHSQFRSFDYVPYLAHAVHCKHAFPVEEKVLDESKLPEGIVWYVDAFGNCKLTSTSINNQEKVETKVGTFNYYQGLRQVPAGETAVYQGSSGLGHKRFLELSIQKGNAAKVHGLAVGDQVY